MTVGIAIDDGGRLLLFDPIAPPSELGWLLAVDVVLATHGGPTDRAALEGALS